MAITPIELPGLARPTVGIEAILARGTSALASVLQTASQVGRDQANNQARQERDFLTEQQRAINLDQRRGENVVAQANNERNFNENSRQFDVKFGEGVRQFDVSDLNADQSRAVQEKSVDANIARGREALDISQQNADTSQQNADTQVDDLTFRRNKATEEKAADKEVHDVQLETAKVNLEKAKGSVDEEKAKRDYKQAQGTSQSVILGNLDQMIRDGKTEEAKSYFTTTMENPAYDFPTDTKGRIAKRLGITPTGGDGNSDEIQANPVESMSPDQIDEELGILNRAVDVRGGSQEKTSEKRATRIAELEARKAELKNQPSFMKRYGK